MSWMTTPVRIIPALNTILDAILERVRYKNSPGANVTWGGTYDHYPQPYQYSYNTEITDRIRDLIRNLYREHFPPSKFGQWSAMRPYAEFSESELDDAIAIDLQKANIDPNGYLWRDKPHWKGDGTFVMACYHLLNNVLLYQAPDYFEQTVKTQRPGDDWTTDGNHGYSPGTYVGKLFDGRYYYRHFDRRFNVPENRYPKLQGNWKGRCKDSYIYRNIQDWKGGYSEPLFSEKVVVEGSFDIGFSGNRSDEIPWLPEVYKDIDYYTSLCKEQYYYRIYIYQHDEISEINLTAENFTPPNYKYYDPPQ